MIGGKTVLAIIPARGGSKGLPGKNLYPLSGKPLLAWTIEAAKQSQYIDHLILSSDDAAIIKSAKSHGCDVPFIRPNHIAQDDTSVIDVILHAIEQLPKYDYIVLLQPTSPLRNVTDIDESIEKSHQHRSPVVTVTHVDKSPYWMYHLDEHNRMSPLLGKDDLRIRQQLPSTHVLNGAVYVSTKEHIREEKSFITENTVAQVMPRTRSIDIDSMEDILLASLYLEMPVEKD